MVLLYLKVALVVKNLLTNTEDSRGRFDPWVGKIPWSRKWQFAPVFLPGKSHGQSSLGITVHGAAKSQARLSNRAQIHY